MGADTWWAHTDLSLCMLVFIPLYNKLMLYLLECLCQSGQLEAHESSQQLHQIHVNIDTFCVCMIVMDQNLPDVPVYLWITLSSNVQCLKIRTEI